MAQPQLEPAPPFPESVWITWEKQRRSVEMAGALGAQLQMFRPAGYGRRSRLWRYAALGLRTLRLLIEQRPRLVFGQNPSIVLATILCVWKALSGCTLVIDRHSNFKLDRTRGWRWRVFHRLSRFTVRRADLTIVTNDFLCDVVDSWGGRGYVLQDRIPRLEEAQVRRLAGQWNVVYVCTFSDDEPVDRVLEAAALLADGCTLYVTGDHRRHPTRNAPSNVVLTGYVDESDYQTLLRSADVVMVLTTQDHTLTCGAYEAVALGKAMVLSDTPALRSYFSGGAQYCRPDAASIARAVRDALAHQTQLERETAQLRLDLRRSWEVSFARLCVEIGAIVAPRAMHVRLP